MNAREFSQTDDAYFPLKSQGPSYVFFKFAE